MKLRSRNDKDFNARYPAIVKALAPMPDDSVIDGEVVALDEAGEPSFSALQNGSTLPLIYYVFDEMILAGKDVFSWINTADRYRNRCLGYIVWK